jgi:hypothetical protein
MGELLAPGGTLAVVGLTRPRYPVDLPFAAAGAIGHRVLALRRSYWEDSAPRLWPPPDTFGETRRLARRVLPGVRLPAAAAVALLAGGDEAGVSWPPARRLAVLLNSIIEGKRGGGGQCARGSAGVGDAR